jgi:hypothetical protein
MVWANGAAVTLDPDDLRNQREAGGHGSSAWGRRRPAAPAKLERDGVAERLGLDRD